MDFQHMKMLIDAQHPEGDSAWQTEIFAALFERFSVIPIAGGIYKGTTPEEVAVERKLGDKKASTLPHWQKYCTQRNPVMPVGGDKLGICTGPASGLFVVDVDNAQEFTRFCNTHGLTQILKP